MNSVDNRWSAAGCQAHCRAREVAQVVPTHQAGAYSPLTCMTFMIWRLRSGAECDHSLRRLICELGCTAQGCARRPAAHPVVTLVTADSRWWQRQKRQTPREETFPPTAKEPSQGAAGVPPIGNRPRPGIGILNERGRPRGAHAVPCAAGRAEDRGGCASESRMRPQG